MTTEETYPRPPGDPAAPTSTGTTPTGAPTGGSGADSSTKEEAKQRTGAVAGTAKDEAANVVEEGRRQAGELYDQFRGQVDEQVHAQRDRVGDSMRTIGQDLSRMSRGEQTEGQAQQLVEELGQRAQQVGDWISQRSGTELAEELRSFARRKPGTFLLGSLALGVLAGRLTRGAKAAASGGSGNGSTGHSAAATRTAAGSDPWTSPTGAAGTTRVTGTAAPTSMGPRPALAGESTVDPGDPLEPSRAGRGGQRP
ncbi:MAG TPA: hypothetical protein VK908_07790 [Jiangellales bacterium]|nr:hypothetical protein [Jiangellales bacterium]